MRIVDHALAIVHLFRRGSSSHELWVVCSGTTSTRRAQIAKHSDVDMRVADHSLATFVIAPAPPCTAMAHAPSGFGAVSPRVGVAPTLPLAVGVAAVGPVGARAGVTGAAALMLATDPCVGVEKMGRAR